MGGRLDTLQAAILNVKLDNYNNDILRRQKVADNYSSLLNGDFILPFIESFNTSVWAQYSIRVKNRENIQALLKEANIPTAIHYPKPLHLQKCFDYLGYKKGDFPISEIVSEQIMSLPMNPYIKLSDQHYICDKLNNLLK